MVPNRATHHILLKWTFNISEPMLNLINILYFEILDKFTYMLNQGSWLNLPLVPKKTDVDMKHIFQIFYIFQNQSPEVFYKEGILKFHKIHKKISVSKSLFELSYSLKAYNLIKKTFRHKCFPTNFAKC